MIKPIQFLKRPHLLHPAVDIIGECKNNKDIEDYIAGVFAVIRVAEVHKGKLMEKKPEYISREKNSVIFSFSIIFPNMEARAKFLKEQVIIGIIGSN